MNRDGITTLITIDEIMVDSGASEHVVSDRNLPGDV